jgi:hypothetical protein
MMTRRRSSTHLKTGFGFPTARAAAQAAIRYVQLVYGSQLQRPDDEKLADDGLDVASVTHEQRDQLKRQLLAMHPQLTAKLVCPRRLRKQSNPQTRRAQLSSSLIAPRWPTSLRSATTNFAAHLVPLDEDLRMPEHYPDFVRARRKLLADAMTKLLGGLAPPMLADTPNAQDHAAGERLTLAVYGESPEDPRATLMLNAESNRSEWQTSLPLRDIKLFITDLENGFASALTIAGEGVDLDAGADGVELPVGPLLARGTLEEWRAVLEREVGEMAALEECPPAAPRATRGRKTSYRSPFSIPSSW